MKPESAQFRKYAVGIMRALKHNEPCIAAPVVPVANKDGVVVATLRVVTKQDIRDTGLIRRLAAWRRKSSRYFPTQFRVTVVGTRRWATKQLLAVDDRILLLILDLRGRPIGHMGLNRFEKGEQSAEIDNVIRGANRAPGVMTYALLSLMNWGKKALGIRTYYLRCFSDNGKAMALYTRMGFVEVSRVPLMKVKKSGVTSWEENPTAPIATVKRYFVRMKKI